MRNYLFQLIGALTPPAVTHLQRHLFSHVQRRDFGAVPFSGHLFANSKDQLLERNSKEEMACERFSVRGRPMSDDAEARLRNLRGGIGAVVEILEGVKERTRGFALKQVAAEKALLKTRSRFDDLRTQLAERISKVAGTESQLVARHRDHDHYLDWLAVNNKLAILTYFRRLRDNWSRSQTGRGTGELRRSI
jgi:hypothetical protein